MSDRSLAIPPMLREATERAVANWPALSAALEGVIESERYRRWLRVIEWRLERTLEARAGRPLPAGAYGGAAELLADVRLNADSLAQHHGG